jgi:hypothetical protein
VCILPFFLVAAFLDDQAGPNFVLDEKTNGITFFLWVSNGSQPYQVMSGEFL